MGAVGEKQMKHLLMKYAVRLKPVLKGIMPAPLRKYLKDSMLKRIDREIAGIRPEKYDPTGFPWGINLIGPLAGATGLGQSFRLVERVMEQTEIPYLIYDYAQNTRNRINVAEYENKIEQKLKYGVNLWHINPSDFAEAYADMGRVSFDGKYNIAFWLWELED